MRFLLAILLLIPTVAMADVYIVTMQDGSIYSLSEQDDAVVPSGYKKDIIVGKSIADLAIDDISIYNYKNGKISVDSKKASDKNKVMQAAAVKAQERIDARISALAKLKALGLTDIEIEALFGVTK